jgi:FkbM family methyltransferase
VLSRNDSGSGAGVSSGIFHATIFSVFFRSLLMNALAARPQCPAGPTRVPLEHRTGLQYRIRRKAWQKVPRPFLLKWLSGIRFHVASEDETFLAIFATGEFEPSELHFLDQFLKPGMTVIDVGANLGLYSLFASRRVEAAGTVLAIEASAREFAKLRTNVELNKARNVRLLQVAASNRRAQAPLRLAVEYRAGYNTLGTGFTYDAIEADRTVVVQTDTLDEIVRRQGLTRVDLIKLDIEGAEYFALQGARETIARFHPVLLLELTDLTLRHQGCSSEQVWNFLIDLGYALSMVDPQTGLIVPARKPEPEEQLSIVAR